MGIDLRQTFKEHRWYPTCCFDDERAGIILSDNTVVVGYGFGLDFAAAEKMAGEHNAAMGEGDQGGGS